MTDVERVAQAFEEFEICSHDPKWSSWLMDQFFASTLGVHRGTITEIFRGLDLALKRHDVRLTETVASLIVTVIRTALVNCPDFIRVVDWDWAQNQIAEGVSPARAYLFLHCIPPETMVPASLLAILRTLAETTYFDEALIAFADDFERPVVREELQEWRSNGWEPRLQARSMLSSRTIDTR